MSSILDHILTIPAVYVYLIVALLVFAEDAIFVGFVIPGETAAVIGGVDASRSHVSLTLMIVIVVVAAIAGDSVGFEIGKHLGPRVLEMRILQKHRTRLDKAQDFLARRGGWAVFLGRFVAFFRAVMPALAGIARMPYRRFLPFNALGGLVWGAGFVVLGYLAGNSYETVAKTAGRGTAIAVAVIVIVGVIIWRVRTHLHEKSTEKTAG
ncbi:DedA family protein [Williamsia sterculiae]|uniref:Membrane protein DedA, SNARE-associated domain n=1 Tax=Williamsia sterculiae TaxID=1344003 RepID=A0A1N7F4V6_9NOCA|nr:DedA family protein [Williamsia sterculiae]SIR95351.1 membrane protein DedA, SNARE-associated domain [Williamsia sterculiae]